MTKLAQVTSDPISYDPPPSVSRFLARSVLLYGIPFQYLVPDERMLPRESVRFFFVDPGWISTMLQGAASVGRMAARDTVLDMTLRRAALKQAMLDASLVRRDGKNDPNEPFTTDANWPLTGFLLRSEVVEGFQGLEMRAYNVGADGEQTELPPLRIDRLAPDLMLCLFNGKVTNLEVKQPPEGFHFGLSPTGEPGAYQRLKLRKVTPAGAGGSQPGRQIPNAPPTDAPMRKRIDLKLKPTRVVQIAKLAALFQSTLQELGDAPAQFTSAEFGVQMVESAGLVEFKAPPAGAQP